MSPVPGVTLLLLPLVRTAYGFLLAAAVLNTAVVFADAAGVSAAPTMRAAVRHALAQGFLLPVIVFMAALLLNGFNAITTQHPRILTLTISLLFAAAGLRAGAEFIGGYAGVWGIAVVLGGLLSTSVFVVFVLGVFRSYRHGPVYHDRGTPS
ncbi:MAG: hypothetical protein NTZ05_19975 [Chloroflexi bacterium]|nr:hypothetical protein [Chloroflexota bacterium]